MIAELLFGGVILSAFGHKRRDTHVKHGKNLFGCRYKEVSGECFRCNGSGKVHGKECRKCGGSGKYSRTTWQPRRGEIYVGTDGVHWGGLRWR